MGAQTWHCFKQMRGSKGSRLSLCPRAGGIYILIPVLPLPLEAACPGWELGCKLELWCGWACSLEPGHDMARAGLSKWWRMYMLVCSVLSDSLQLYRAHKAPLSWDSPGKNIGVGCISSSRGSSAPRDRTRVSCVGR